jgi:glycolate oxidase FAD binding subunit
MSSTNGGPGPRVSDLKDALAAAAARGLRSLPRGGGTKDALSSPDGEAISLDLSTCTGIVEYAPSEFTVTALAGTPIAQVAATLGERGQYLPFDPILIEAGATIGGTIAAGVSGSGRARYGGIRDFILGVRFLDGGGTLVRGGGKVVKNAAGFDLPKLMVGSLGSLGVVVEATFKVFPRAEATATGTVDFAGTGDAVAAMRRLLRGPSEVDALDLEPPGRLWVRMAGRERAIAPRLERALGIAAGEGAARGGDARGRGARSRQVLDAADADAHWREMRELAWVPAGCSLVKAPLQPGRIAAVEEALASVAATSTAIPRAVYTAAGQQALIAWPGELALDDLDRALQNLGLSGLVVRGRGDRRRVGIRRGEAAIERARRALDPQGRFREP